jgi:hypothetical protein
VGAVRAFEENKTRERLVREDMPNHETTKLNSGMRE